MEPWKSDRISFVFQANDFNCDKSFSSIVNVYPLSFIHLSAYTHPPTHPKRQAEVRAEKIGFYHIPYRISNVWFGLVLVHHHSQIGKHIPDSIYKANGRGRENGKTMESNKSMVTRVMAWMDSLLVEREREKKKPNGCLVGCVCLVYLCPHWCCCCCCHRHRLHHRCARINMKQHHQRQGTHTHCTVETLLCLFIINSAHHNH